MLHKLFKLVTRKRPSIELVPPKKYLNFSKWLPSAKFPLYYMSNVSLCSGQPQTILVGLPCVTGCNNEYSYEQEAYCTKY